MRPSTEPIKGFDPCTARCWNKAAPQLHAFGSVIALSLLLAHGHGVAQTSSTVATALMYGDYPAAQGLSRTPGERAFSENRSTHWISNSRTGEWRPLFIAEGRSVASANFGAISLGGVGIFARGTQPSDIPHMGWPWDWNKGAHITSYTTGAWGDWWTVRTPSGLERGDVQVRVSGILRLDNTGVNWNIDYQNSGQLFEASLNGRGVSFSIVDNRNHSNQYIEWETVLRLPLNQSTEIKGSAFLRANPSDHVGAPLWGHSSPLKREFLGNLHFYTSNITILGPGALDASDALASMDAELPLSSYSLFASSGALELGAAGYNYKAANELISSIPEPQSAWMLVAGLSVLGSLRRRRRA